MSRTGRFGRQPRAVPSLGNTLVAIAREQERTIDQSIMDAWTKGGTYRGQKVTDAMVLAHWRGRLKDIGKDDPLADVYKNVVLQYEYSIAESKMTVDYAQRKIGEKQAAAFYMNWAKKVPKDSEFYRVLMRDAAQYINAAKNRAAGMTERLKEEAYQAGQKATQNRYERSGAYMTEVLTGMAVANGLIDSGQNLGHLDLSDASVMQGLIHEMNAGLVSDRPGETRPVINDARILYKDPRTGKAVTAGEVNSKLAEYDPHFTGTVTLDYVGQTFREQATGQSKRYDNANKTGHVTEANRIATEQASTVALSQITKSWPAEEAYEKANAMFSSVFADKRSSPAAMVAAHDNYMRALNGVMASSDDPAFRSIIEAEINGNSNIESLATQMGKAKPGDAAETQAFIDVYRQQIDDVATGKAVWTYGEMDNKGLFTAGKGTTLGAAPKWQVDALSPIGAVTVFVAQGHGLPDVPVLVAGKPITVDIVDASGKAVKSVDVNSQTVGAVYDVGGESLYGFRNSNGGMSFTRVNPWAAGVQEEKTSGGITLHVAVTPGVGPNFVSNGERDANGNVQYSAKPAGLVIDGARAAAQGNPMYDSSSPTIAFRVVEPDGAKALYNLSKNNPAFAQQLEWEAHVYGAGQRMTTDPATGAAVWTGGGGDPAVQAALRSSTTLTSLPDRSGGGGDLGHDIARELYKRSDTAPAFNISYGNLPMGPFTDTQIAAQANAVPFVPQLPSDASRGTPFEPLASAFTPGQSTFAPPSPGPSGTTAIRTGQTLTLPTYTPVPVETPMPVTAITTPYNGTKTSTQDSHGPGRGQLKY